MFPALPFIFLCLALDGLCSFISDLPKYDLHVHLTGNYGNTTALRYEKAAALSAKMGVTFGIAEEIGTPDINYNNRALSQCLAEARKYHLYIGLQVNQPGWTKLYSRRIIDSLDYVSEDALRFPDKNGQVKLLWTPGVVFPDPQDFMDRYVLYNLRVLSDPITIWVNPTFLPVSLQSRYDELWTDKRMRSLIDAAVKNNIAIEINSRYQIPSKKFILMAKAAGAHFTFGSNEHDVGIGETDWSRKMANDCGLTIKDLFIPPRKL